MPSRSRRVGRFHAGRNPTGLAPARHVAQTFPAPRAWANRVAVVFHRRPMLLWFCVCPPACIHLAPMFSNGSFKLDFLGDGDAVIGHVRSTETSSRSPRATRADVTSQHRHKGIHGRAPARRRGCIRENDSLPSCGEWTDRLGRPRLDVNDQAPHGGRAFSEFVWGKPNRHPAR